MKFLKRLLKAAKTRTSKTSPRPKSAVVVSAIAPPRPARNPTKALIERYKVNLKAKNQRELRKIGHELAEQASTDGASNERIASLLSRGHQWNSLLSYLGRVGPAWMENPTILLQAAQAERHLRNPAKGLLFLEKALPQASEPLTLAHLRIELAFTLHDLGRITQSVELFREIVADPIALPRALPLQRLLADAAPDATKQVLENACLADPANSHLVLTLGEFHRMTLDHEGAFRVFQDALRRDPENAEFGIGLMKAALALSSDDHLLDAVEVGEKFFFQTRRKDFAGALVSAYLRYPSSDSAENGLDDVYYAFNSDPDLLAVVSEGYLRNANIAKAEVALRKALELDPDNANIVYRLSGVLAQQSKPVEAIANLLHNVPDIRRDANFYAKLGHLRAWSGDHLTAIADLRAALVLDGQNSSALADLAHCYDIMGDVSAALLTMQAAMVASVTRPLPRTPGFVDLNFKRIRRRLLRLAHLSKNQGLADILSNDIRQEEALSMPYPINNWEGQPLDGRKIMCIAESGIGDEMRYTASYRHKFAYAKSVAMTCDPRMLSILKRSFPTYQFYPVQRTYPRLKKVRHDVRRRLVPKRMSAVVTDEVVDAGENADLWVRGQDIYETTFFSKSHPPVSSSLTPDPDLRIKFRETIESKKKGRTVIGLSWRGGHHSYNRDCHYFSLRDWEPILDNKDFCFVNLQYSLRDDELSFLHDKLGDRFIEFNDLDLMDDIEGVAALCAELDHVIGVCTAVLELAGAVGAPTLFLMRSPESSQSVRLTGTRDAHGTFADSVWAHCRILPKRKITDAEMAHIASAYIHDFSVNKPLSGQSSSAVVKVLFPGNRGSGGSSGFDTAEIQD